MCFIKDLRLTHRRQPPIKHFFISSTSESSHSRGIDNLTKSTANLERVSRQARCLKDLSLDMQYQRGLSRILEDITLPSLRKLHLIETEERRCPSFAF